MDPKLAEIYGTNQTTDSDLEKLAAAELADSLSDGEETNVDGMTEEDLEAIAQNVLGGDEEPAAEETEAGDDSQEKVAEADYLGRVMAHAYVQELGNIEKVAYKKEDFLTAAEASGQGEKNLHTSRAAHEAKAGTGPTARAKMENVARGAAGKVSGHLANVGAKAGNLARMSGPMTKGKAMAIGGGVYGAGALGAAGLAMGAKKLLSKKDGGKKKAASAEMSAVDTLIIARAQEILDASGLEIVENEQEKVSADETMDPREVLAATVEQRAWDLLSQYGVVPEGQE